jgi:hypothetical protein
MITQKPWSHSALSAYETCGRQYYLTKVSKEVYEPPSDAINWGRTAHEALQRRLDLNQPLPESLGYCEPLCKLLTRQQGKLIVEEKLAINASFSKVKWMAKDVWCRSVIDVGVIGTRTAVVADWKTGKRKPESDQLELFAGVVMACYPYLEEVHTAFIWLPDRKVDSEKFTRAQVQDVWNNFLPRVLRYQEAHISNKWQPKPSGLCKKWCPVSQRHCEFSGRT